MASTLLLSGCALSPVSGAAIDEPGGGGGVPSQNEALPATVERDIVGGQSWRGLPPGVEGAMDSSVGIAWSPQAGLLYVVTYGSSSCPTQAEPVATMQEAGRGIQGVSPAEGTLRVKLVPWEADDVCTMDIVPTTTVVETPTEADTGQPLRVLVEDKGAVLLEPRSVQSEPGPVVWLDS